MANLTNIFGKRTGKIPTWDDLKDLNQQNIDELEQLITDRDSGKIPDADLKPRRLLKGVYGQRQQEDQQMVRIKVPGGVLNAKQSRAIGSVVKKYSGQKVLGHITTRQDIQVHFVKLQDSPAMLRELHEAGITTREACGNTIRNVSASPISGGDPDEVFNAAPHSIEVTNFFLFSPLIEALPRKFKMSFSGGEADHALGGMHDLGFVGKEQNGEYGYKVVVGGGLGSQAHDAAVYSEFIPLSDILQHIEAVLTVFNRDGERKKRGKARIKYLVKKIGIDELKNRCQIEYDKLSENTYPSLSAPQVAEPVENDMGDWSADNNGSNYWYKTNVFKAQGKNKVNVRVRVPIGDLTPEMFDKLADLAEKYGNDDIRLSADQNVWFVKVNNDDLKPLYEGLKEVGLHLAAAHGFNDPIGCPGASTCNLAVTASRGLTREISRVVTDDLMQKYNLEHSDIHISGCMNSCGQHHLSTMGFYGRTGWSGENMDQATPFYSVLIGGGNLGNGVVRHGLEIGKLPAKRIPEFILWTLDKFAASGAPNLDEYLRSFDKAAGKELLGEFEATEYKPDTSQEDYVQALNVDWDEKVPFIKGKAGESECA